MGRKFSDQEDYRTAMAWWLKRDNVERELNDLLNRFPVLH